jgi:preprotein translocase subunit SecD
MNFYPRRFNTILTALTALALVGGCVTGKKDDKHLSALRLHVESSANVEGGGQTVSVLRNQPVLVTIGMAPVLTEANVIAAKLLETPGGFALEVKFDETGAWILEQYSSANPGKHFVIFGQWSDRLGDGRWLAAPQISRRLATGVIAFTPDASRDEAKQLVLGLNNAAKINADKKR